MERLTAKKRSTFNSLYEIQASTLIEAIEDIDTFNSLYEIPYETVVMLDCDNTFNSLYEIPGQVRAEEDSGGVSRLSILFMRFLSISSTENPTAIRLSILFMRFGGLWKHGRVFGGFSFNSLYEILCYSYACLRWSYGLSILFMRF